MRVVAKKSKYRNVPGKKKVKLLTADKTYLVEDVNVWGNESYLIKDDTGQTHLYNKNYFITLSKNRDNVLKKLGL